MPGNEQNVTLLSHTAVSENSKATSPTPAPRTSTPKQDGKNTNPFEEAEEATSNKPSPILPTNQVSQLDETPPPVPPKHQALLDRNSPDTIVPRTSSSQGEDEPTHAYVSEILSSKDSLSNPLEESPYAKLNLSTLNGSADSKPEKPAYAVIDKSKKIPKKSPDNQTDSQHPTLSRSVSQETVFDNPDDLDLDKTTSWLKRGLSRNTSSSFPPSYKTDGSEQPLISNSKSDMDSDIILKNKKINRVLPRAQYAIQQKGVVIFGAAAIVLGTSTALVYLQDKAKFITFFTNSPLYTVVPIIAVASLFAISPMLLGIKQFVNTKEYQTQEKNADEVLDNVLRHQPEDKVIKSVRLEYSNGTHSNFVFNAWESKKGFVNIDEKVISKTNKIESVINNRPLFTALLTGVVAANIALPLLLYAEGGVNNIQKFYQNPLTNNIRLLPLIGLGIFALLAVCLGVHYYRKTNCTNLVYSEETIDPKNVNGKFIEEIKRERTNVLGENHSKDAKRSSLTLEQVVVQSHNYKDAIYSIDG
ncbi:hypothetical protein [Wolbachia endosymbiont of Tribolium confusum]|uniref:hypothetical protein n=1 Tax=Wolbachia endosymbiont of Tribolium confusum TaxID=214474 RepID=UPI001CF4FCE6|nr:hypothetical protein [Wolbachia endosymbiont of Tribolium confusum]MCA7010326.1 hypothetical protein [Wolbachia endosymbiont of Tribolium confusum]